MTTIEISATCAINSFVKGDESLGVDFLVDLFNEANSMPEEFAQVEDHAAMGNAFLMMLAHGISADEDNLQQIASISYLFLTKAIERNPSNASLIKNRILLIEGARQYLAWTIIEALNLMPSAQDVLGPMAPNEARRILYKMQLEDLEKSVDFMSNPSFTEMKSKIFLMITNEVFGPGETRKTVSHAGYEAHKKVLFFLHDKVINNADIDF